MDMKCSNNWTIKVKLQQFLYKITLIREFFLNVSSTESQGHVIQGRAGVQGPHQA